MSYHFKRLQSVTVHFDRCTWVLFLLSTTSYMYGWSIFISLGRYKNGRFHYFYRRAWRRVPKRRYQLFARVRRRWRKIVNRRRRPVVRVGGRYSGIRITSRRIFIRRRQRWLHLKRRRRLRRRRRPWRRGRRTGRRRYAVMRLRVGRIWRKVYYGGGKFFFRYGRKSYRLQ